VNPEIEELHLMTALPRRDAALIRPRSPATHWLPFESSLQTPSHSTSTMRSCGGEWKTVRTAMGSEEDQATGPGETASLTASWWVRYRAVFSAVRAPQDQGGSSWPTHLPLPDLRYRPILPGPVPSLISMACSQRPILVV